MAQPAFIQVPKILNLFDTLNPIYRVNTVLGLTSFSSENGDIIFARYTFQRVLSLTLLAVTTVYLYSDMKTKIKDVLQPDSPSSLIGFDVVNIFINFILLFSVWGWISLWKPKAHRFIIDSLNEVDKLLNPIATSKYLSNQKIVIAEIVGFSVMLVASFCYDYWILKDIAVNIHDQFVLYVVTFYIGMVALYVSTLESLVGNRYKLINEYFLTLEQDVKFNTLTLVDWKMNNVGEYSHMQKNLELQKLYRTISKAHSLLTDILDDVSIVFGPFGVIVFLKCGIMCVQKGMYMIVLLAGLQLIELDEFSSSVLAFGWIILYSLIGVFVISQAQNCCEAGNRTSNVLNKLLVQIAPSEQTVRGPDIRTELLAFGQQVACRKVNITAFQYGSLNYSLVMPVGILLTLYLVMVLQITIKYRSNEDNEDE